MGSKPFSDMAINETNRQVFINSTIKFLRRWNFDGLDIDWEFPAKREGSRIEDKESLNFLVAVSCSTP
jgi:chitinase